MRSFITHPPSCPRKAGIQGARRGPGSWTSASALGHAHMFGRYRSYREPLPLSAPKGGEGDTIPRGLRSAAAGVFRFGSLDPTKQRITAAEQRESPLFLRSPSRRRPRIPAENAITFADNFLRKQRKQREAPSEEHYRVRRGRATRARYGRAEPRGGPSAAASRRGARSARDGAAARPGCRSRSTSGRCRIAGSLSAHL